MRETWVQSLGWELERHPQLSLATRGEDWASLVAQMVKAPACNAGDPGSIPGMGRTPGDGNGNPLQYSCLENPMDGEAWQAIVYGVAKS